MKTSLRTKYVIVYFFLFFSIIIIANTYGIYYLQKKVEINEQQNLYNEANLIADNYLRNLSLNTREFPNLKNQFNSLQCLSNMRLLLVNVNGTIILDSDFQEDLSGKSITKYAPNFLDKPNFIGNPSQKLFRQKHLFVIYPLTDSLRTTGYIVTMKPLTLIHKKATSYIDYVVVCFLIFFFLLLIVLIYLDRQTIRPLKSMTKAATEYAKGHFDYKMDPVKGHDFRDLAAAIQFLSEKMNSMNDYQKKFIANVSHDFRSPLTSIHGYTEAMKDGTIPYEKQEKYLDIILFETERLEKLTKNLLSLNQFESNGFLLEITTFNINQIIKQTSASFEQRCKEKHISIDLIFQQKNLYTDADMDKIERVIQNLLDNAIKFSPNNSKIEIHTIEKLGKIFISVKDHGIGIPKDCINKIWTRFYKTDLSRGKDKKGTGLGLSIVKEIIEAHGENINVISTEGVGTEFIFSLKEHE